LSPFRPYLFSLHATRHDTCRHRPGLQQFRLEIGSYEHLQIQRVEYLKETVRQGNGLDDERNLTPEAMERGWACLARFGERLRGFDPQRVRAVATQTLREARNREALQRAAASCWAFPLMSSAAKTKHA
jgi:exopolyphosphatase/guanosine-5'-triphosphate,3'-diphosphate pyrophosphatase